MNKVISENKITEKPEYVYKHNLIVNPKSVKNSILSAFCIKDDKKN